MTHQHEMIWILRDLKIVPRLTPAVMFASSETRYLWILSQSTHHLELISHPVVATFMNLKWKKLRLFYYGDLVCQYLLAIL